MITSRRLQHPLRALALIALAACDLAVEPYDGQSTDRALATIEGLRAATLGNYHILVGDGYVAYAKVLFYMGEFPSDDVSLSGTTSDPLFYVYNYAHYPNMGYTPVIWREAYRLIYGANQVIEHAEEGVSPELDQLAGENLFLRALAHFHLVTLFGRPYPQGRDNPGIPIIASVAAAAEPPSRNTVGEVYDFIVADLKRAARLMTMPQPNRRASKEVAYALLSRVYLYMEEHAAAIAYADSVIASNRYQLLDTETLRRANELPPESEPETIFALKHTPADDKGTGAIGSMYFQSPAGVGWGEMYASRAYRNLLDRYPEDARHAFIEPQYRRDESGAIVRDATGQPVLETRNGYPRYFVDKFSSEQGIVTLSSPTVLRLAEVYLNRAEAYARLGRGAEAIADVNRIRSRAGLSGTALYFPGDLKGNATVLDVVLEERRLELAFEGHRKYDLFRNGRALVRDYPGTHLNPTNPGVDMVAGTQVIAPDHARIVFFIPEAEIELNPKLIQNR
jgi:starch-binding outer membrane protein, SusD/RagB family